MGNSPLSILVIDEDARSGAYFGALLAKKNYAVQTVASGRDGYITALRDRPDVIILDPDLTDMPAVELLKKLRGDKRTASTFCIALAAPTSKLKADDMISAGCNEFFSKTHESVEKLFTLLAAPLQESAGDLKKKRSTGGILGVFLSAKGGVGTSSLCVNIARSSAMANSEMDVAVMDLVLPIGSLASIVGYQGDFDLVTAASHSLADLNSEYLRRMLGMLENWRFRLLAGSPSPESADALDGTRIPRLIQALRQTFDLTFIDMGRSLSPLNLSVIQEADVVVIVTGPDLSTITLTQKIWQYLQNQGVDSRRVYLLLNRSVGQEGFSKSDAEGMIGMDIKATIPYMGGILSLANNQHLPILIKMPNDTAAMMIDQISREILETARRNRA